MVVGFSITIEVEDAMRKLESLRQTLRSPIPCHKEIATYLENQIPKHIQAAVDEAGVPWKPLSPVTIRIKQALGYPLDPLVREGHLRGEISSWYSATEVATGSALPYAPRQQLGDSIVIGAYSAMSIRGLQGGIPARPYLYLREDEADTVVDIYEKHIERAIELGPQLGGQW